MHLFLCTLRLLTEKRDGDIKGLRHSSAQHLVALIKLSLALTYGRIIWKWFMIMSSVYQSVANCML